MHAEIWASCQDTQTDRQMNSSSDVISMNMNMVGTSLLVMKHISDKQYINYIIHFGTKDAYPFAYRHTESFLLSEGIIRHGKVIKEDWVNDLSFTDTVNFSLKPHIQITLILQMKLARAPGRCQVCLWWTHGDLSLGSRASNDSWFARLWHTRTEIHHLQICPVHGICPLNWLVRGVFTF